ncbi:MAG: acetyl-CoA carboxylase carboxyltransferase subunit alpha [Turicibacter sp.]|nr:acetyl-CoA carboxylase carboxyltransferase subunit alpha [Turicibacter sp.]
MSLPEMEKQIKGLQQQMAQITMDTPADEKLRLELSTLIANIKKDAYERLTPGDKVYLARHPLRPNAKYYIDTLFEDFTELHGDRLYGDDQSIMGGIGTFDGKPVTVIAQMKGKTLEENLVHNFGMPHPEGYRKVIRLARQAEKFGRPIINIIDTPGAYPGIGAEERGQAEAIAQCLMQFMELKVPVIAIVIGEGGSGGALALSISDHIMMLEHSIYSVLSPEGFASILWKDSARAGEAAQLMKLTAQDLKEFGIVDSVIKEPVGGIHSWPDFTTTQIREKLTEELEKLAAQKTSLLLQNRYKKFRAIGVE